MAFCTAPTLSTTIINPASTHMTIELSPDGLLPIVSDWDPERHLPEQHPMYDEQVRLEQDMMNRGADKYRDRVIMAKEKGQMSRQGPLRHLMSDWLPRIVEGLRDYLKQSKTGPVPIALPLLQGVDHYAASAHALRAILDGFGRERRSLAALASGIGLAIEHEQRVRLWRKTNPTDYFIHRKEQIERQSTATHRRRVNANLANKSMREVGWEPWSQEQVFRVGLAMLDIVIKSTGWFEIQADPTFVPKRGSRHQAPLVLAVKEGMVDWVEGAMDAEELRSPEFRPMVMPPKRWTGTRKGGYWTPYVRAPRLVRFKADQEHQKERAADEYDAFDFPKVYKAVHLLQETAWRINGPVLDVAWRVIEKRLTLKNGKPFGKLPELDDRELPPRHPAIVANQEATRKRREVDPKAAREEMDEDTLKEFRKWRRAASKVYDFNAKRLSRLRGLTATIHTAMDYRDYDAIYFPHMLDFRGRIYPIPAYLHPQGADLARGLLTFAEGLPITEENGGSGWLAVQLATSLGVDKVPFDKRIAYVEQKESLWRTIAADPLDPMVRDEWGGADKPWQALAAIFEWVAFLDHGYGYVSHLPIMVDGTCNGIQHLSAMTRDKEAGFYVNLVPSPEPQDIYKHVAEALQETLERILKAGGEPAQLAAYWLNLTNGELPRSLTKRQVMVLPYGGTRDSFFGYTREWLDEVDPEPPEGLEDAERELRNKRVAFLSLHMWDAVNASVTGGMKVMAWVQACAKAVCEHAQPIYWITPSGYVVRHFYGTVRSFKVETLLDGQRVQIRRAEYSDKLSTQDQLRGIAPNYIHSLDGSCLVDCVVLCEEAGIQSFASIHDAYGTHAANMFALSKFLREAFIQTHSVDNMGQFRWACMRILVAAMVEKGMDELEASDRAELLLPPTPELGDLALGEVANSEYFFA